MDQLNTPVQIEFINSNPLSGVKAKRLRELLNLALKKKINSTKN